MKNLVQIREEGLDEALDLCNDAELKAEDLDVYKERVKQLELKKQLLKRESDPAIREALVDEIDELYFEIHNIYVTEICREFLKR